jgi:hypothetical protein
MLAYPNPGSEWINIQAKEAQVLSYELKNVLGQVIDYQEIDAQMDFKIDMRSQKNGVYFIDVKTLKGSKTFKIIKN